MVPSEVLGRTLSVGDFGSFASILAGLVVGGLWTASYGVGQAYLRVGAGILVNGLILPSLPDFRSFGRGLGMGGSGR